jgi:transcriptional regulator with XRE-family HTH domain
MGIAVDRTEILGRTLPASGMRAGMGAHPTGQEIPPREVLRCQHCQLVQFRTQSDMCRRCARPLPSWIPFGISADEEEGLPGLLENDGGENEPPTDRAGRNRRVSIGTKLKEIREQRQLTQVEMSALLDIPRSYLSRIENRRLLPGPLMVAKFAARLEMDISELLPPERRRDGSRLFPTDAGLAALYTQIARLPVAQLGKILEIVRRMVPILPNLHREAEAPRVGPPQPAAAPARTPSAKTPASASLPPATRRLAIVRPKGSTATR